jgi:hypothetical protein
MMVEILTNLIDTYITPIIRFTGNYINSEGQICPEGDSESVYKFENKRYTEDGANGTRFIIPSIPFKDADYIRIKKELGLEIFNPFVNNKHTTLLALLVKAKLIEFFYYDGMDDEDGKIIDDADDEEFIDEPVSFYSINEMDGQLSIIFSNNKDPKNPIEIAKVTGKDPIYLTWLLCIEAMKKCTKKIPKQFDNPETAWIYIEAVLQDWDKAKRKIASHIQEENEVDGSFVDTEDYDITTFNDSDYVFEEDIDKYLMDRLGKEIRDEETVEPEIELTGLDALDLNDSSERTDLLSMITFDSPYDEIDFFKR